MRCGKWIRAGASLLARSSAGSDSSTASSSAQTTGCTTALLKGQIVRLDVDAGAIEVVAEGFALPVAANFDSRRENLYVVDTVRGELVRVRLATGEGYRPASRRRVDRRRGGPQAAGAHRAGHGTLHRDRKRLAHRSTREQGPAAGLLPTGVAVGSSGTIYLSSDIESALYRFVPAR